MELGDVSLLLLLDEVEGPVPVEDLELLVELVEEPLLQLFEDEEVEEEEEDDDEPQPQPLLLLLEEDGDEPQLLLLLLEEDDEELVLLLLLVETVDVVLLEAFEDVPINQEKYGKNIKSSTKVESVAYVTNMDYQPH